MICVIAFLLIELSMEQSVNGVVHAESTNVFKTRLDKFEATRKIIYDYHTETQGTWSRSVWFINNCFEVNVSYFLVLKRRQKSSYFATSTNNAGPYEPVFVLHRKFFMSSAPNVRGTYAPAKSSRLEFGYHPRIFKMKNWTHTILKK